MEFQKSNLLIIVDSREQNPLKFNNATVVIKEGLPTGDYTLAGWEDWICVERKSLSDFLGSITSGRIRLEKEMLRLKAYESKILIIESEISNIYQQKYRSKVLPQSVIGTIQSWIIKYNIPFIFSSNHEYSADFVEGFFYHFMINKIKHYKKLERFFKK